jgi:hypothetical protein
MSETSEGAKPYRGRAQRARKARIKVDLWCEILGDRERAVGHIRNLNVGGCRILSPSAFPIRDTISLVLAGPAEGPDLHLKGQLRWLGLNPSEGPFELGVQFVHNADSALQVERVMRSEMKRAPAAVERKPSRIAVFTKDVETVRKPGAPSEVEVRRAVAAEGLDRFTRGESL